MEVKNMCFRCRSRLSQHSLHHKIFVMYAIYRLWWCGYGFLFVSILSSLCVNVSYKKRDSIFSTRVQISVLTAKSVSELHTFVVHLLITLDLYGVGFHNDVPLRASSHNPKIFNLFWSKDKNRYQKIQNHIILIDILILRT